VEDRCYISAPTGRLAIYAKHQNKQTYVITYDTKYLHKDHLGSVDVVTNDTGAVLERDSFDAWGFRRTTDWQSQRPIGSTSIVSRGFTDHEELDSFGLVNMNGRVYDPGIGRFLSADPFVQAPMMTQNFNRYSYVVNNPLSFTDPSGFNIFGDFFNWMNQHLGTTGTQIVVAVVGIVAGIVTAGIATGAAATLFGTVAIFTETGALTLTGSIVAGAGFGFGSAFTSSIFCGSSLGSAFQAGLIGGAIGAVSGAAAFELGGIPGAGDLFSSGHFVQSVGHAVIGGAASEVQGGNWQEGALAAGLSCAFAPAINSIGGGAKGEHFEYEAARVAASAAIGGTAAELGGGKFANGAVTAAFMRLYNEENHLHGQNNESPLARKVEAAMDQWAPWAKEHNAEVAGTINKNGDVLVGPESGRHLLSSDPGPITSDTVAIWHLHLLAPGSDPYVFSSKLLGVPGSVAKDNWYLTAYPNIGHYVGVLNAPPGQFTIFAQTPEMRYFHYVFPWPLPHPQPPPR
jgi:RHS repeat-associated protein